MELIIEETRKVFNFEAIKPRWCVYAKHRSWVEGKCGFVTAMTQTELTVQYAPDIRNVSNHLFIPVEQVEHGEWLIRVSPDLKNVYELEIGEYPLLGKEEKHYVVR